MYNKITYCCLIYAFVVACSATENLDKDVTAASNKGSAIPPDSIEKEIVFNTPAAEKTVIDDKNTTNITTVAPTSTTSTSTSPKTTAPIPVTTTAIPVTTTAIPVTTTIPVITTIKPVPSSTPTPVDSVWKVINETSKEACILMKSKVELQLSYIANSTSNQSTTTNISLPSNVQVNGSCGTNTSSQFLILSWNNSAAKGSNNIKFTFNRSAENKCAYFISNVDTLIYLNVTNNNVTDLKSFSFAFFGKEFEGYSKTSYTCANPPALKLNGTNNSTGELKLNSLQYEAFHENKNMDFSSSVDCVANETRDIVPILVAGALILLVILVLAAYVITRRRSQNRGYLSM